MLSHSLIFKEHSLMAPLTSYCIIPGNRLEINGVQVNR